MTSPTYSRYTRIVGPLLALVALFLVATVALAGGDYHIHGWTVDGGGGSSYSTDGQYTLSGTIGQPEAGSAMGGEYAIQSGFWQGIGAAIREFLIHLPWINR